MDWAGWATFGFGATVALSTVLVGAQLAGLTRIDIPMLLGTIFVEDPDRGRALGVVMHVANGQVFALLYAGAFAALGRATWWLGGLFGAMHGVAALTLLVPLLPAVNPRMGSERAGLSTRTMLEPPGLFALNYGRSTPAVTLVAHVIYGVLLGVFLQPH
ncbi:MAG: hypothetical protein ABR520_04070 [Mycobacteriales bacterium]